MTGRRLDWVVYDEVAQLTPEQWAYIDKLTEQLRRRRTVPFTERFTRELTTESPFVPIGDEPKAFVKIPTLHPKDANALMLLGLADLDVLISRANKAKDKIAEQIEQRRLRSRFLPGARVYYGYGASAQYGTVVSDALARSANQSFESVRKSEPNAVFAVWDGSGHVGWMPASKLSRV